MVNSFIPGQSRWGRIPDPVGENSLLQGCALCARHFSNYLPNRKSQRCSQRCPQLKTFLHAAAGVLQKHERACLGLQKGILRSAGREGPPLSRSPGRRGPLRLRGPGRGGGRAGARERGAGTRKGLRRGTLTRLGAGPGASVRGARETGVGAAERDPGRRRRRRPEAGGEETQRRRCWRHCASGC